MIHTNVILGNIFNLNSYSNRNPGPRLCIPFAEMQLWICTCWRWTCFL